MIETEAVERKRSRGGFLTLFDWSGKSRKKLLSSTTSSGPSGEASKQEKQNAQNSSKSSLSAAELEETGKSLTYSPRRDSSCSTSTVTSDDRQASRAPSVVARLMGLESLPVPSFLEPRSNTDFDPFFKASTWDAYESLGYVNLRSHYDGISWDHLDSRTNNNNEFNRPINRFQTETLPPKSSKPISVTHNRLLSPIRSPGFVQSRNPAQVMEAASRMIEPSPRIPAKPRFPSSSEASSSSSIPMRIRDLREKLEASQIKPSPQSSNATRNNKYLRGKHDDKRATSSLKTHEENKLLGKTSKAKPSSVSSSHTKANTIIHKQESSTSSSGNRAQKEKMETKNRITSSGRKTVAKQNNQKQNQLAVTSVSKQKGSKAMNNKVVNKVLVVESGTTSRKPSFTATSSVERNTTGKKNLPRKKEPANGVQERIKRGEKLKKCNISVDTGEVDRKKDMDVISFTFSSPIKGISSTKKTNQERDSSALSLSAAINGDSLNILLEQKLRELTFKIESSSSGLTQEGESSGSISKDWVNGTISLPSDKVSSESESVSDCTSFYNNRKFEAEEQEVNSFGTEAEDLQTSNSRNEIEETEPVTLGEAEEGDDWELEYITEIIASGQMMVKETSLGMATDILPWSLFDELEGKRDPHGKVERRTVFEFVNEWLTLRCEKMFMGSCGGLVGREGMVFGRKEVLAEEVKREMERLKKMREMVMMDELVDNEMSSVEGRWLDYKREAYEVGSEIEEEILSDLVDELVSDLLLCY